MIYNNQWHYPIQWCESHGFNWTIRDNHFYWQTKIQTGEITSNNKIIWHDHHYFDKIINEPIIQS